MAEVGGTKKVIGSMSATRADKQANSAANNYQHQIQWLECNSEAVKQKIKRFHI